MTDVMAEFSGHWPQSSVRLSRVSAGMFATLLLCSACSQAADSTPRPRSAPAHVAPAPAASASPSTPASTRSSRGLVLPIEHETLILDVVEFTPSTTSFAEGSSKVLDGLATVITQRRWLVEVEGRVADGEPPALALERANAVIRALLERGADERQLAARDLGTKGQAEGPQSIVTFKIVQTRGADNRLRPVDAFDPKQNPRREDTAPGP